MITGDQASGWPAVRRSLATEAVGVSSTTLKVRRSARRGSESDVSEAALWEGPKQRGQGVDRRALCAL